MKIKVNKKAKEAKHNKMAKKFGAEAIAHRYMSMKKKKVEEARIKGSKLPKLAKDKAKFGKHHDSPIIKQIARAGEKIKTGTFIHNRKKKVQEATMKGSKLSKQKKDSLQHKAGWKGLTRAQQKTTKNAITNRQPGYYKKLSGHIKAIKDRFAESFIPDKKLSKTPNKGLNHNQRGRKANLIKDRVRRAIAKNNGKTLPLHWKKDPKFNESNEPTDNDIQAANKEVKSRKERSKLKLPKAKMDKRSIQVIGAQIRAKGYKAKKASQASYE